MMVSLPRLCFLLLCILPPPVDSSSPFLLQEHSSATTTRNDYNFTIIVQEEEEEGKGKQPSNGDNIQDHIAATVIRDNATIILQEEDQPSNNNNASTTTTLITNWTFKPLIRICLAELGTDSTACDKMAQWDISRVTDCSLLFFQEHQFDNGDGWERLRGATTFNVDLSAWDTSQCTTMKGMFQGASAFNQPIGNWNVGNVHDMSHMFQGANSFHQGISNWNTGRVTDMSHMFRYASRFHNDHLHWNTAGVQQFSYMFLDATHFNGAIGDWDVQSAADDDEERKLGFVAMFYGARAFNQPLHHWKINSAQVQRFSFMFQSAISFNQDLSAWDIRQATDFTGMFHEASSFNQTLCWSLPNASKAEKMLEGTNSKIDGNSSCLVEKQRQNAYPLLPTGSPHGHPVGGGQGEESNNKQVEDDNENEEVGVRWELMGMVLGVIAVAVFALQWKCKTSRLGIGAEEEEEVFFDHSNKDFFLQEHGGQQQQQPEDCRRLDRCADEPMEGRAGIFSCEGSVMSDLTATGDGNGGEGSVMSLEQAVDAMQAMLQMEEAAWSLGGSDDRNLFSGSATQSLGVPITSSRMQNTRRGRLQRPPSQHNNNDLGQQQQPPPDYFDDGMGLQEGEISFHEDEQSLWGQTYSKSWEEDDGTREEMPLEHAVTAMESMIQLDNSLNDNQQEAEVLSGNEQPMIQLVEIATGNGIPHQDPSIFHQSTIAEVDDLLDRSHGSAEC